MIIQKLKTTAVATLFAFATTTAPATAVVYRNTYPVWAMDYAEHICFNLTNGMDFSLALNQAMLDNPLSHLKKAYQLGGEETADVLMDALMDRCPSTFMEAMDKEQPYRGY